MLKVIQINHSGVTVLKPQSEEDLERGLPLSHKSTEVLIDLKGLSLLGNGFIRLLKRIRLEDPALQKKIRLLNPGPLAEKALRLAELDTVYEIQKIYPTAW